MPDKPNIVLAYIHNYRWSNISDFVTSLRRTGFAGTIHFFASGIDGAGMDEIRAHDVTVEPVAFPTAKLRNRYVHAWRLLRFLPLNLREKVLWKVCNFATLRFLLYDRYLAEHGDEYAAVLFADVRDVTFQSNPFATPITGICAYQEADGMTIASHHSNVGWIRKAYGAAEVARLADEPILCSGTILGETQAMMRFLTVYRQHLLRARRIDSLGVDQGVYNSVLRANTPPDLTIYANGVAQVLTMGLMNPDDIRFDAEDRVVDADGRIIPILHQFDRHPAIAQRLGIET